LKPKPPPNKSSPLVLWEVVIMLIGCLTWGSLVWNPGDLPIRGNWQLDGPLLPIEFARVSKNNRITLVILGDEPDYSASRSLWTLLDVPSAEEGFHALREREGIGARDPHRLIGLWEGNNEEPEDPIDQRIATWAKNVGLDAVVWTKLGPKWIENRREVDRKPTQDEVKIQIRQWGEPLGSYARLYFQMAPKQIDTPYRRGVLKEFGWPVLSPI